MVNWEMIFKELTPLLDMKDDVNTIPRLHQLAFI